MSHLEHTPSHRRALRLWGTGLVLFAALFLMGCGGGGGGGGDGTAETVDPGAGTGDTGSIPPPAGSGSPGGSPDPTPDPIVVPPEPDPIVVPPEPDPIVVPPEPDPIVIPPEPAPLPWWPLTDVHAMSHDPVTRDVYYLDLQGRLFAKPLGDSIPVEIAATSVQGAHGLAFAGPGLFFAVVDMPGGADDVLMRIDLILGATEQKLLTGYANVECLTLVPTPAGAKMYMVDGVAGEVLEYDLASDTLTGVPIQGGHDDIRGLTIDPDEGAFVAIDASQQVILTLVPATGATTVVRDRAPVVDALVYDATSRHYHASLAAPGEVHEVDLKGVDVDVASIRGLAYEPTRDVYFGSHVTTTRLVETTRSSGWTRVVGYTGVPGIEGLAYDPAGARLYGVSSTTQALVELFPGDGSAHLIGPVTGPAGPWTSLSGLAFGRGRLFAVDTDKRDILMIDPANGGTTLLATLGGFPAMHGMAFDPNAPGPGDDLLITYDDTIQAPIRMPVDAPGGGVPGDPVAVGGLGGLTWVPSGPLLVGTDIVGDTFVTLVDESPPTVGHDAIQALVWIGMDDSLLTADVATETLFYLGTSDAQVGSVFPTPTLQIEALAYDVAANTCYAVDAAGGSLLEIDPISPAIVRVVGSISTGVRALAYDEASGRLYGVDSDTDELLQISTVDATTVSMQAAPMTADRIEGLTFVTGQLLGFDRATRTLVFLDPGTGFEVPFPAIADPSIDIAALAWNATTNTLYGVDLTTDRVVRIDPTTGQLLP